jgi:SAM-dependent methyltransferase
VAVCAAIVLGVEVIPVVVWQFPYASDDPVRREDAVKEFYTLNYAPSQTITKDTALARAAADAKTTYHIREQIDWFVSTFKLQHANVLDVGSGSGYLQDAVDAYTGLDISTSAARYYHKRFIAGTATAMPFANGEFDAVWSIWVLEHIPNPEAALSEIRRVVKPGGVLFLRPAWDCKPWAADGYAARPYSDFGIAGKFVKATIPIRSSYPFWFVSTVPSRLIRWVASWTGPTRLHYRRLEPNYHEYWQEDSDAVNSLDAFEMAMWFESRGDECLNCWTGWKRLIQGNIPLIIHIKDRGLSNP